MSLFHIEINDLSIKARIGILKTFHGEINTPIFMQVGTLGSVKFVSQNRFKNDINAQIILANSYHLYLRPGIKIINKIGGIHNFISWKYQF